jgi:glycosyltransferase involved in cell wall biosynthesis
MRIVVDLQSLQTEKRNRGIGRYSLNLAEAMVRRAREHEVVIVLNGALQGTIEPVRERFRDLVPPERIRVWSQLTPTAGLDEANQWRARASELLREHALCELTPDIVHVSSLFEGLGDDAVTSVGRLTSELPTAVTLYDLIPFVHPQHYLADPAHNRWHLRKIQSLQAADLLLAISEYSRAEAIDMLGLDPDCVVAIAGDADARFRRLALAGEPARSLLQRCGLDRPAIMYTGGIEWRKNIEGLIEAYARLPQDLRRAHQLAIVCRAEETDRRWLLAHCERLGLRHDDVVVTGYVSDDDLVGLYNLCKLFVFPSLHEGFGLPPLEAMRCGAPVIGSDRTSIPEVIGWSDALFDPTSVEAITGKLTQALSDDGFRATLRDHGTKQVRKFSWDESARKALDAFEALHGRRRGQTQVSVSPRRPRLAYLSPLPPERSGIATYSAELLPELARYYEIELITDLESVDDAKLEATFARRSTMWFEAHTDRYDRILYHIGNAPFHCDMLRLLRQFPGLVVLHDFFLSGMMEWMDTRGPEGGVLPRALYHSHGWRALVTLRSDGEDLAVSTYPCNLEVIERAHGILVHSRHSKDLAQQWFGQRAGQDWGEIPSLRGVSKESDRARARQELSLSDDAFVVCSFGIIALTKMNDRILSAWLNSSLHDRANCRLVFVGDGGGAYRSDLEREIQRSGCGDSIATTGYVTSEDYARWLSAADVGVQLRAGSRGETSRTVLDCLAYGLATVANAHGSMSELPGDRVMLLANEFADADLIAALERLYADADWRKALGRRAREHIRESHAPRVVARRYAEAIEGFASTHFTMERRRLLRELPAIAEGTPGGPVEIGRLAECVVENTRIPGSRQILVDVTRTAELDLKTGIERVAHAVLVELLRRPPAGYRVEPVWRPEDGDRYYYLRSFTESFLELDQIGLEDAPVHIAEGDIFLALDPRVADSRIAARGHRFLRHHADRGLRILFLVYDLLPVRRAEWFPSQTCSAVEAWLSRAVEVAHGFACISQATADDLADWIAANGPARRIKVGHLHLGADIENTRPPSDFSEKNAAMLAPIEGKFYFLMVGTVEPRKGHAQALEAIERLWAQDEHVALAIVGKRGWMVEPLVTRLRHHPEAGRRLFWFDNASDEVLGQLYRKASALLMASEGEGFGLPIIEAARHGVPVIARDLPVFREVAGEHAFYFSATDGHELADALREWLALYRRGEAPSVAGMPILTWAESTRQLLDVILGGNWYRTVTPARAGGDDEAAGRPPHAEGADQQREAALKSA